MNLFETEHAKAARRIESKLREVYEPSLVGCTFSAYDAWVTVGDNVKTILKAVIAEDPERGLIAGLIQHDGKSRMPKVPLSAVTTSELEAWINKHVAERRKKA